MWALFHSSFVRSQLMRVVLVPAVVAALAAMSSRFFSRGAPPLAAAIAGLVVPAAFLAGYFAVYRDFTFPPATVLSWVPWFIVALLIAAPVASRAGGVSTRAALAILVAASGTAALLWPILEREPLSVALATWALAAAAWSALWVLADARGVGDAPFAAIALIVSAGLAVVAPLSGSILLGELAATLAVALVASLILNGLSKSPGLSGAGRANIAFVLGALVLDLRFYAGVGAGIVGAFVASFALGLGAEFAVRRYRRAGPWAVLAPVLAASIPVVAAVTIAFKASSVGGGGY